MRMTHQEMVMVFRSRRGLALRPVNRIKHVFDEQGGIALGTNKLVTLITASDTPDLANTIEVQTGATVNGIFLSLEVVNDGATGVLPNAYMIVLKNPGGNLPAVAPNTVGSNDNKRFVIHQEMIMLQAIENSNPRTLFKGVIVLPRGYRRFGPNDTLQLRILSPGIALVYCVQCHYKEFR